MNTARPVTSQERSTFRGLSRFAPSLYAVAAVTVLGGTFVVGLAPRLDTDLWWHLLAGSYVSAHGWAPSADPYSFTMAGRAWTDHEWLSQLAMYSLYAAGGVWAVTVAFAILVTAAFGLIYLRMVDLGVHRLGSAFLLAAGFGAASPILGARPQMVTLLFMAIFATLVGRFLSTGRKAWLIGLPLCMLIWVNAHGGFCLGLLYIGLVIAGQSMNILSGRRLHPGWRGVRALGLALAACLAATAVNPYGWRLLLYPFQLLTPNAFTNSLNEWSSVDFHMPQMMLFEALFLLLIAAYAVGRPRLDWVDLAVTLVFTYLTLAGARNVAVWVVLLLPTVGVTLQAAAGELRARKTLARRSRQLSPRVRNWVNLGFLALVLAVYLAEARQYTGATALAKSEQDTFPARAVAFMATHHLPRNVFAPYAWGGYVVWKLPGYRDFIDGRANTLFNATTLHAYLDAYSATPSWSSVLRFHHVDDVLLDSTSPLAQVLALSRSWKRVFRDHLSVVYVPSAGSG